MKCKKPLKGRKKRWITIVSSLHHNLAIVEILIGVWQATELSGTPVQVDIARTEDRQETNFCLSCVSCGDMEADLTSL